ncbi:hypothetical protein IJZ97_06175 [bacterium]|nr:hypothetical protein [bacterium]
MKKGFKKFSAFTFAEVMISLTIIGVIAALTMPNILQDYQNRTFTSGLANSISILEKGFEKMMIDDRVSKIERTRWVRQGSSGELQNNEIFDNYFRVVYGTEYFSYEKYSPFRGYIEYGEPPEPRYITKYPSIPSGAPKLLNNGSYVWVKKVSEAVQMSNLILIVYVDVNGSKGPNMYGYDLQKLGVDVNGRVVPLNLDPEAEYSLDGAVGAKRIRDDGWRIKY